MAEREALQKTANNILKDFLHATKRSKILLFNDHDPNPVYDAFREVLSFGGFPFKEIMLSEERRPSAPIPEHLDEMLGARIIIAPTKKSITHCPETIKAEQKGAKIITLPGITEEVFLKIENANFKEMDKMSKKIAAKLRKANKIQVTTPKGTNLTFYIKKRKIEGLPPKKGKGFCRNLPSGEVFCAPIEETADGEIKIDYWKDILTPKDNAWVKLENGKISEWNKEAEPFIKEHSIENGFVIAEFGIGVNKAHKFPIGNTLHDEKIYGTCHIAFGNNVSFGGRNRSEIHTDIILIRPTIMIDGTKLEW
jgi:leucyl aminopeptidase (aminopeptidase T)